MNLNKNEKVSHVDDIGKLMVKFLSKEGSGSFPTITVLLNRIFISPDEFTWKENGNFYDLPKLKEKDALHWYKVLGDLYESNVKPSINVSVFPGVNMFTKTDIPDSVKNASMVFVSKNKTFIITKDGRLCKTSSILEGEGESISDTVIPSTIVDHLFAENCDFFLANHAIYRYRDNDSTIEKVYDSRSATLHSFCYCNTRIVVASSVGGLVFSNVSADKTANGFKQETTITHESIATPAPTPPSEEGSSGSGESGTQTMIYTVNGVPQSNRCTCVYAKSSTVISLGDESTAGEFTPGDRSTYGAKYTVDTTSSPPTETNPASSIPKNYSIHSFASLKNGNAIYNGHVCTAVPEHAVGAFEYGKFIYIVFDNSIGVYPITGGERFLTLDSSNGLPQSITSAFDYKNSFYLLTSSEVYRSVTENDSDNNIGFIAYGFVWKPDNKKDFVDARQVKISLKEILDLGFDRSIYQKRLAIADKANTTFIISWSKTDSGKVIWNLYGNDERVNEAKELKKCCSAFDIEV